MASRKDSTQQNMKSDTSRPPGYYDQMRIMLRPIASGMPLGFFSFGIGMLMLACASVGLIPTGETTQLGLILALFVFPLELLAAIFAFLARDSTSAATLGLFSTSWLTFGVFSLVFGAGTSVVLGVFQLSFALVVLLLAVLAVQTKPFFTVLLVLAALRMILGGTYELGAPSVFYGIAGYVAFVVAVLAFYGGVAFTLEDAKQRPVLPLFRRGAASAAFSGYTNQLERVEAEPGIRQQL